VIERRGHDAPTFRFQRTLAAGLLARHQNVWSSSGASMPRSPDHLPRDDDVSPSMILAATWSRLCSVTTLGIEAVGAKEVAHYLEVLVLHGSGRIFAMSIAERLEYWRRGAAVLRLFGYPEAYGCPLCLRLFCRDHIDQLSLDHVPPKSVGSKLKVLTCKCCNSRAGNELDAHAHQVDVFPPRSFRRALSSSASAPYRQGWLPVRCHRTYKRRAAVGRRNPRHRWAHRLQSRWYPRSAKGGFQPVCPSRHSTTGDALCSAHAPALPAPG
jgi:hypothetical protein